MYFKDHEIQMEIYTIPHFRLQRFNKKKLHVNDSKPLKETALSFFLIWGEEKKKRVSTQAQQGITALQALHGEFSHS